MLFFNEGFTLDDAGNMITTTYVDLRQEVERTAIPALIKGCRREHALEDGEAVLISKPARFREYGEKLILDLQEGLAREELVTEKEETAVQASRRRAVTDLNEAQQFLKSRVSSVKRLAYSSTNTRRKNLAYGDEWWIYCASIRPPDEEWDNWRSTLPEEYDHISEIGQPSRFAQALAHMVTEQIGPQGQDGWLTHAIGGTKSGRTQHKLQWILHGPVLYTDGVYDALTGESDDMTRIVASIFTKGIEFAAQREYRFAVLNEGAEDETVLLKISGMMRDALKRTEGGLTRTAPTPSEPTGDERAESSSRTDVTLTPLYKRTTRTERRTEREERHWETRTSDGQMVSSEGERREVDTENTVSQEVRPYDDDWQMTEPASRDDYEITGGQTTPEPLQTSGQDDQELSDEETVQELALEERDWNGGRSRDSDSTVMVHGGTGRAYRSFEDMLNDPACPINPIKETWQEKACSPEEIAKTYGVVESLDLKMAHVGEENRQDLASASWYAMQCVRNIYARLGDIVESVWIERERFVVIHLKEPEGLEATGRIVISPSGAYAYCLQLPTKEISGNGGERWGTMFFPLGEVESFEEFGWPAKSN